MPLRINLSDHHLYLTLAPHTLFKPSPYLRCGMLTLVERYKMLDPTIQIGFLTAPHLSSSYPSLTNALSVDAGVIPTAEFLQRLKQLCQGEALVYESNTVASYGASTHSIHYDSQLIVLKNRWDLPQKNAEVLWQDFTLLTHGKVSAKLPTTSRILGPTSMFFMEEGAIVNDVTFNTNSGPIYLAALSEVMEGSLIRGPFSLGEKAQVKMGAKIYGATTIGPECKVGGEINNMIFESFSNKSHDGFLGNGYISSWCNIGADTNASNLMNNYGVVDVHDYATGKTISSGEQFVGLHMGDHSKCGINTMFNTGTCVGVACNIYGPGFFKKHIPSFSFGEPNRLFPYRYEKAMEGILSMMARRNKALNEDEVQILRYLCDERELF
ncbi:MAG: glucose-1-phosphate thymidylyltransferase [Bacteroidetes bacterium]|nr:glucose-1-phosphate thymidylyltransferase [Bacteroidota bacterium]MBM3423871.1 glucose-1-phosphate thymidylyltransferase [Bacteroidota bacterium]